MLILFQIKEIENNKDILEETYEQLQNEKEKLEEENQLLTVKIENLNVDEQSQQVSYTCNSVLNCNFIIFLAKRGTCFRRGTKTTAA